MYVQTREGLGSMGQPPSPPRVRPRTSVRPRTRETMHGLERMLWHQLEELRFRADEAERLQARKRLLILAFDSAMPWDQCELYQRFTMRLPGDALAELFHRRLATPTRRRLLRILRKGCQPV